MDASPAGRVPRDPVSILVADSNQTQSQLLSSALGRHPGFKANHCAAELSACLQAMEIKQTNIVLLRDGLAGSGRVRYEILRALHSSHPLAGLILLADSYDRELVVNALRSGASGLFCLTNESFKSLCRCISTVHQGQVWASTEQLKFVVDALSLTPSLRIINAKGEDLLTEREQQVVALVAEGVSNRELSRALGITENTVKKSLLRIYDKLGVANRVELVLYSLSHHETCTALGNDGRVAVAGAKNSLDADFRSVAVEEEATVS